MKISKKTMIISIITVALLMSSILFIIVTDEPKKEKSREIKTVTVPIQEPKKKKVKILPHRDNEQDKNEEVVLKTKKIAEKFATSYVTKTPQDFQNFLETVKPITEERLFNTLAFNAPQETNFTRNLISLQSTPLDDILENRKKWQVIAAIKEVKDSGFTMEKQLYFNLYISKEDQNWVITGLEVRD